MSKDEQISNLKQENEALKHEVSYFKNMLFGKKSERLLTNVSDPQQLNLGLIPEEKKEEEPEKTQTITYKRKAKNNPVRKPLPEHLPRKEEIVSPKEDVSEAMLIGQETTEFLEITPAQPYVRQIIRKKYKFKSGKIVIAPLPDDIPIKKSNAGATVLGHAVVSKYVDHLPLHRQLKQLKRNGLEISESTYNGWVKAIFFLLTPLYEEMMKLIKEQNYLQIDESTIKVLENKKSKTHQGYMWVYHSPKLDLVHFEYHSGRNQDIPKEYLKNFEGYLQTDGYAAYNQFEKRENIELLTCWAHIRRKFFESQSNDKALADYALEQIGLLYAIEKFAKNMDLKQEEIQKLRDTNAPPIIDRLLKWAMEEHPKVPPKSPIGKAISYLLRLSGRLKTYCQQGELCIDNNPIERLIRPLALGRKNFLFAGNHDSAKWSAMFYSFFGTCQAQGLNPYEWIVDVLRQINEHPVNRLRELLPLKENFS